MTTFSKIFVFAVLAFSLLIIYGLESKARDLETRLQYCREERERQHPCRLQRDVKLENGVLSYYCESHR